MASPETLKSGSFAVTGFGLKTGLVAGGKIEIKSGLKEGDIVVARSGTFLRDGDVIRPIVADDANKTAEAK